MKQSAEELELVKKYAEMPLLLDVIEEDKKRIGESSAILKRELRFYLSALQDRVTADIYELKKALKEHDIKIIEQKRTEDNLFISYSIRGYQYKMNPLMSKVRTDGMLILAQQMNVIVEEE
ncbi:hypothetical protein PAEAM_56510 [Paenibacillus sp. GM1FR]|uniref:hypothetical protein n=1 Tax=Paenibacillus sp. GM1FR TaxID=2059267 RepID=UPI000C2764A3|nr:hypothetical protein [Paenibacillus sp. GM1FR]PJN48789.1 hypothetical protein PAEAM_56510 [Paenibacillus sp. GM1FR]